MRKKMKYKFNEDNIIQQIQRYIDKNSVRDEVR